MKAEIDNKANFISVQYKDLIRSEVWLELPVDKSFIDLLIYTFGYTKKAIEEIKTVRYSNYFDTYMN